MNDILEAYSPNYAVARERFLEMAAQLGWELISHPVDQDGPDGEPLFIDVAISPQRESENAVVVSSGLHGIEGFFGSAVQLSALRQWRDKAIDSSPRIVMLHALNPFGFAWSRRFDGENIDPNRNFLLPDERFDGCSPVYRRLNRLLNPPSPPRNKSLFACQALWAMARYGKAPLKQAIAEGQYEFPQGLFFGGHSPSVTNRVVSRHLCDWIGTCRKVVHLDFHTGLGNWGASKLLLDGSLSQTARKQLDRLFGPGDVENSTPAGIAYQTRGGFGRWCQQQGLAETYLYLCAEFGTYRPLAVLAGLREENRAHHWEHPPTARTARTKNRLQELFCPQSPTWRRRSAERGQEIIQQAVRGLYAAGGKW